MGSETDGRDAPGAAEISDRIVTVPNILSSVRLLLVPVFFALLLAGLDVEALLVLVASAVTDFLDGYLARRLRQVTRLGQVLDPAADRLYIVAAVVALAMRGTIPWWLVALIVGRDLLLVAVAARLRASGRAATLPVSRLGKVATFCLFYALPIIVLVVAFPVLAPVAGPIGWAFAIWGTFLYWWAGIRYAVQASALVRAPVGESHSVSDNVDSRGGRHGD